MVRVGASRIGCDIHRSEDALGGRLRWTRRRKAINSVLTTVPLPILSMVISIPRSCIQVTTRSRFFLVFVGQRQACAEVTGE